MQKNRPIQSKLMAVMLTTSGVVLLLTCAAYFVYEFYSFRRTTVYQLTIISKLIASNSTAALAFQNVEDANKALSALQAEPHIRAGVLYNEKGEVFAQYHSKNTRLAVPQKPPEWLGFRFEDGKVAGSEPVIHDGKQLGTLYLQADMNAMYERFQLYMMIAAMVILVSFLVAYLLSGKLQKNLTKPILDLADTAKSISENADYSVRAKKYDDDEVGLLTDAFNKMLARIENQNQEITSFNQDLEMKVASRTREIETAYKEMEAFSYTVSHDLNAPLRHIDAYISLYFDMYENKLDDDAKNILETITKNAQKMRQLIDDLLAFSQLGRQELTKTEISMSEMVMNVWEDCRKLENGRDISFTVESLPPAYGDTVTMHQVWQNFISNAIKYSRHEKMAEIQVGFKELNDSIAYSIRDNGAGFDMREYHKLFNVFQRLHPQSQFEGTGVGLAIVERIISRHEGKVWAESKPGEGSTFYFSIPKKH